MRASFAPLAFAALAAATPVPQGVTESITPDTSAPAGCSGDYSGSFAIQIQNVTSSEKRSVEKRQMDTNTLIMTLNGGVLKDNQGRTGYVAANNQFQFDAPPQTGAIYTAGFSVCGNGSLAIGGDAVWYKCLSGTFYNLYDNNDAGQCSPVYIQVVGSGSSSAPASQAGDGQPTASPVASQIPDGQITASPVASVSVLSDGQPQAPTSIASPVASQLPDGQVTASPVSPITQISDGQPQAPTAAASPVTQISDGQIQAPTTAVCQIADGQPQAGCASATGAIPYPGTNSTLSPASPSVSVTPQTGSASSTVVSAFFALAAGVVAIAML